MLNEPNSITMDLSALIHNLNQVRALVSQGTRIMGVVKADAYGHGLLSISRALEKNKIHCLGVAYLYEAIELRKKGIGLPIVILTGIHTRDEAHEVVDKNLTPVLYDLMTAEILAQESERLAKNTPIHLKLDTGMGRLGISHSEIGPFIRKISTLKNLNLEALTSHLSSADERVSDFTDAQIKHFKRAVETARSMGFHLPLNSLANSAGIMAHKDAHFEMVRPGIALYGGLPSPQFSSPVPLRPVMHFKGRILQIRDLPDRTPVSYGRTFHSNGRRRIAILSAGYADGLPRSMSNAGHVLIGERKAPLVGMICMNLAVSDITGIRNVGTGDEAVFLGTQGKQTITGDDVARSAGTISYEVFCSLGQRNKKEYRL
ncbi:MAG: alanine racemase [Deltaproteobacteria bacterium]|nr:alanine racemase [Deltaproteobacteria bacterium]